MNLKIYRKKRNFKKTTEPRGISARNKKSVYVIQKHAASHLHYDFRLALKGALVSWAIPKKPSLDPKIKRLAIHVEDHPLEYANFEGIIPAHQYGAGTVAIWDKGQWSSLNDDPVAAYEAGNMSFILQGKKLKGKWKLIRINKNDKTWLLIKIKDVFSRA